MEPKSQQPPAEVLDKSSSLRETTLDSIITEFALSLAACCDGSWRPSGTAVIVGPGLAITAKHVLEDYWGTFERAGLADGVVGTHNLFAFQVAPFRSGQVWSVTRVSLAPWTDIAFLELTPYHVSDSYHWRWVSLNLLPPEVGSRIAGFGYCESTIECKDVGHPFVNWVDRPSTSIGEVVEIHPEKRDSAMLPFPCFRTNAPFQHGMSGGPVFNDAGELCGLICSGIAGSEGEPISYACSLWPAMVTRLQAPFAGLPVRYFALELARSSIIRARNWEFLEIGVDEVGAATEIRLKLPDA